MIFIPESLIRDVKYYQQRVAAGFVDHVVHEQLVEDIKVFVGVPEAEYFDIHRDLPYFEARFGVAFGPFKGMPFLGAASGSPHPSTPNQHLSYRVYSVVVSVALTFGIWALAYGSALFPAWGFPLLCVVPFGISWVIYLATKFWFVPKDIDHRMHRVAELKQLEVEYERELEKMRKAALREAEIARLRRIHEI